MVVLDVTDLNMLQDDVAITMAKMLIIFFIIFCFIETFCFGVNDKTNFYCLISAIAANHILIPINMVSNQKKRFKLKPVLLKE